MKNYMVCIPYVSWKTYEVNANNEQDAINKTFKENNVEEIIQLCDDCNCVEDELMIVKENIYAEEIKDKLDIVNSYENGLEEMEQDYLRKVYSDNVNIIIEGINNG